MNTPNQYFLYARKSTDTEDRQVRSIDDQIAELQEFAVKEQLEIVDLFIEKQTAKDPGRPVFNEMLQRIEKGEASGILSWHPDRLARNSVDGGRVIYLLDIGKIANLKFPTFWFENTPQGKFMLQIAFGQSKYYVDNLSENIKRGIRQKLKHGIWPQIAPLGYANDKNTKTLRVDQTKAVLVRKTFELYAAGRYSLADIQQTINHLGLVGRRNQTLSIANYHYVLKNPFYFGLMRYHGELYEGKHEPLIPKKLFDQVQQVMQHRSKPNKKKGKYFTFRGFIYCGECRCLITAELQKGHVYYRCTKRKQACGQKYIREEVLSKQIAGFIQTISLEDEIINAALTELEKDKTKQAQAVRSFAEKIQDSMEAVDDKLERLLAAYLEDALTLEEYQSKKNQLIKAKADLKQQLAAIERKGDAAFEPLKDFIQNCKQATKSAKERNLEKQKEIITMIGSNFHLTEKRLGMEYKNPWKIVRKWKPILDEVCAREGKNEFREKMRWEWDSNPRYLAARTHSKRVPSTTRPSHRIAVLYKSAA